MNLTESEEQILIKNSAKKFLELNYSFDKRRQILENKTQQDKKYWKEFADLGWLGLPYSESYGGFGGNINNLMTLMECQGSALVLEPYIFNNLVVGKILEKLRAESSKRFLEDIITGNKIFTFLFSPFGDYRNNITNNLKVRKEGEDFLVTGRINCVFGIEKFDLMIIPLCLNEKVYLFITDNNYQGIEIRNNQTIDDMIMSDIEFNSLKLSNKELVTITSKNNFFKIFNYIYDLATLAMCSQALGIIDIMYNLTLDYCKTREQFGRKISSFQVIQHRLVDMHIIKEEMRSLNYMGQLSIDKDHDIRSKNISLNKIFLGTRANIMAKDCIQLHGGMGVAKEMSIGHFLSKITVFCSLFGSTDYHKERYSNYD